jgi:hypothetical protein
VTLQIMEELEEGQAVTETNILALKHLMLVNPMGRNAELDAERLVRFATETKAKGLPTSNKAIRRPSAFPASDTLFELGWIGVTADGAEFDLYAGKARKTFATLLALVLFCRHADAKEGFLHWLDGKCSHENFFQVEQLGESWEVVLTQSDSVLGIHLDGGATRPAIIEMVREWRDGANEVMATAGIEYRLRIPIVDEESGPTATNATPIASTYASNDAGDKAPAPAKNFGGLCDHCEQMTELRKCSRCHAVSFCSRECQLASWKAGHKLTYPHLAQLALLLSIGDEN